GDESLEVKLFREDEIPWEEIAFPPILRTIQLFFEDRSNGHFRMHDGEVLRNPRDRFNPTIKVQSS
ncbi:MAG: NUDIX hydrolase, partial [Gammaproteobacteria bacterium]|nr:NUDIX hydrolase [Gammaproteobacteria bacterium]